MGGRSGKDGGRENREWLLNWQERVWPELGQGTWAW